VKKIIKTGGGRVQKYIKEGGFEKESSFPKEGNEKSRRKKGKIDDRDVWLKRLLKDFWASEKIDRTTKGKFKRKIYR